MQIFYELILQRHFYSIFESNSIKKLYTMKKIALIALAIATLTACKNEPTKDYTVLSGKIDNVVRKEAGIVGLNLQKKIKINDDGTFLDTLKVEDGYYTFISGPKRTEVYLKKGNDLKISFDLKDTSNTFNFDGKTAKRNTYLAKKAKAKAKFFGAPQAIYSLPENEFLAKMDATKKQIADMINNADIDADFKARELRNLEHNHITNVSRYPMYHGYFTKNRAFKASDSFPNLTKDLDMNNEEDFKLSSGYRNLLQESIQKAVSEKLKESKGDFGMEFMKVAKEKITNPAILGNLFYNNAKNGITYTENLPEFYKMFMDNTTNKEQQKEITEIYEKLKSIAKGQPSPKFENYENINGGTTSLDDLKGKYVYVDVWATWCGPCIKEIPALKEMEKKYHGKNVEFVSISIDNQKAHATWKKMVEDKELKGVQLFADKSWGSKFVQDYQIKGIPRFILIDPNGNIVSANAPRPSDPRLVALFNELKI